MSREPELAGRSALVTGASRGIGRSVAEGLSGMGARVFALARTERALSELADRTGALPVRADLTDETSTWEALDAVQEQLGGAPDIVVNAAGVFGLSVLSQETVESFDEHLAVNLRGPFLVTRLLLPSMLERGSGLLVQVGSVAGHRAFPRNGAYSASKFGLRGLHEVLLEEVRGTGVRATLVEPAATDTPVWDPLDPDGDPSLPDRSAMLSASDVAEAVLWVATRPPAVRIPLLRIERA